MSEYSGKDKVENTSNNPVTNSAKSLLSLEQILESSGKMVGALP